MNDAVPYDQLSGARKIAETGAAAATDDARVMKEVEARVLLAKRFPRDEEMARSKILGAFGHPKLAEEAIYSYPRGDTIVSDLSIRAAETIANYWGNLVYGIREISRSGGKSEMQSYCWDMETNVFHERNFIVRHWRDTRSGGHDVKAERDIYEITFNAGARRLRSCILECIPAHIKSEAETEVQTTLRRAGDDVPIEKRLETMLTHFKPLGVTEDMIVKMLLHKLSAINEQELIKLRQIYRAILEGQATVEDYFEGAATADAPESPANEEKPEPQDVKEKAAKKKAAKKKSAKKKAEKPEENTESQQPGMTYGEIFKALTAAKTVDQIDTLMDAARDLKDEKKRNSITAMLKQRREDISDVVADDDDEGGQEEPDLGLE